MRAPDLLLYDGHCALCSGVVRFVVRRDHAGTIRFAALSGTVGAEVRQRHPELERVDSLVVVEGYQTDAERVRIKSGAVLRLARYLGGLWKLAGIGYLIPREIRDSLYDVVAWWRYRLFGRYDTCPLPPPETRHRFLP